MAEQTVPSLMYQIGALKEELDIRASSILGVRRSAFQEMFTRSPRTTPPELAFYQVVTWLYGFYYEAGRVSLPFLIERFETYGLALQGDHRKHHENVRCLRTYLQHNLNLDSEHDLETQRRSEDWFAQSCGSTMPGTDKEWNDCVAHLLKDSEGLLTAAIACVRAIEQDESSHIVIQQWSVRLRRYHPLHEFEKLVAVVVHDLGQDSLDVKKITARFYEKWSKELRSRSEDYIFEEEARRQIEHTILSEAELPPPISGPDVMREFGMPPGSKVGEFLRFARVSYYESPCNKDQLMARLKERASDIH